MTSENNIENIEKIDFFLHFSPNILYLIIIIIISLRRIVLDHI